MIERGQTLGLIGPNGAGKSSLFNMATMDVKRTGGDIKLMNKPIDELKKSEQGQKIGIVPQYHFIFPELTVDESLEFIANLKGVPKKHIQK